jgi:hypothetical protein
MYALNVASFTFCRYLHTTGPKPAFAPKRPFCVGELLSLDQKVDAALQNLRVALWVRQGAKQAELPSLNQTRPVSTERGLALGIIRNLALPDMTTPGLVGPDGRAPRRIRHELAKG